MKNNKTIIIVFISALFLSSCLKEGELKNPFESFDPIEIEDGTIISTPSFEGVDSMDLVDIYKDIIEDENLWTLKSMLIYRNGNLIAEDYFKNDNDISERDLIWSCTKQFMGVLVGVALDHGLIASIDDPMSKYMPEEFASHPDKADITIRNFITMQSGIDFENSGATGQTDALLQEKPDDMVEFILSRPINFERGTKFHYNDGDPNMISAMIQKLAGKATDEWADDVLFSKIGFENYSWTRYRDGISFGAFGIKSTPREMAKLALLVANGGKWKDSQIVSQQWIEDMASQQVVSGYGSDYYAMGYYWWINEDHSIIYTAGHGGQYTFIIPEKDLIVAMTSIPNLQDHNQTQPGEAFEYIERIVGACF